VNIKDLASGALQVLKTVAPTIADTLAGPFAPLVDPVVRALFGTTDAKQVSAALLNATPEQLLALKQADNEHAEQLIKLGIDRDKLAFDDTASARAMQIATKDPNVARLAWLIIGGFLFISLAQLIAMMGWAEEVNKIPPQGWLLIGNISGYLANEAKQAAAFYFGSTAASQAKDVTIADIAKQP
jgi:hypothetical protein